MLTHIVRKEKKLLLFCHDLCLLVLFLILVLPCCVFLFCCCPGSCLSSVRFLTCFLSLSSVRSSDLPSSAFKLLVSFSLCQILCFLQIVLISCRCRIFSVQCYSCFPSLVCFFVFVFSVLFGNSYPAL